MTDAEKVAKMLEYVNKCKLPFCDILENAHILMLAPPEMATAFKDLSFYMLNVASIAEEGREYTEEEATKAAAARMEEFAQLQAVSKGEIN